MPLTGRDRFMPFLPCKKFSSDSAGACSFGTRFKSRSLLASLVVLACGFSLEVQARDIPWLGQLDEYKRTLAALTRDAQGEAWGGGKTNLPLRGSV